MEVSEDLNDGVFSQSHSRHNSGPSSGTASRHNSGHSIHGGRKKRSFRHSEDVSRLRLQDIVLHPSYFKMGDLSAVAPLVVRTSQSGIIPDTPGPLPEISGLIPDNAEIDPTFQVRSLFGFDITKLEESGRCLVIWTYLYLIS